MKKNTVKSPIGTYRIDVVSLPEECDFVSQLPPEIQFIFARSPVHKEKIRSILQTGKAIGVRTILKTPENILQAIHHISTYSQHNYIVSWLPQLLRDKHLPVITSADEATAKLNNVHLASCVETIIRDRLRFKRLVLIDEENVGSTDSERRLMNELSEILYPLQIDYAVHRAVADNADERTEIAQSIIKVLLFVGPIAHILEKFAAGVGKIFAASADDILGEVAELSALHGSGFKTKELVKRSYILIPVFILASYGAYSVHYMLDAGRVVLGGAVFGLSAVALSLTTAIQSLFMYRHNAAQLLKENKINPHSKHALTKLALWQDFTNPARFGLFVGAACAPFMGILGSILGLMHNGWVLAGIGATESIVAGLTVIFFGRFNEWRFERRIRNAR